MMGWTNEKPIYRGNCLKGGGGGAKRGGGVFEGG